MKTKVLEIIAEKTGYPPDMLDLDLDLEADLGIDTVKAGGDVRCHTRRVRHSARRRAEAAGLPDAGACDPVRPRPRPDLAAQAEQVAERPAPVSAGAGAGG